MHAIIRQGSGKYYISAVFGYYRDITATDDYERYLEEIHKPYWIVWNPEKTRLIRWLAMVPNTKYLIPQILIVDTDQSNWNTDQNGVGCVDFLSRELLDSFLLIWNSSHRISLTNALKWMPGMFTTKHLRSKQNRHRKPGMGIRWVS